MRSLRPFTIPAGAGGWFAAAGLAGLLAMATGVAPLDLLGFVAFHLLWVLGPGLLATWLLMPDATGALRRLVFGWALGYPMEMGAFAFTAAIGQRDAFLLWPVVVALAAGAAWRRRRRSDRPARPPRVLGGPARVLTVAVTAALLVHLASFSTEEAPLAPADPGITYNVDYVWNLGYAAEARLRWPMRDPNIAGALRPYHSGWALDAAAANQVTGVGFEEIVSRLQPLPLLFALPAAFALLGFVLCGSAWPGALGMALFLLVGDTLVGEFPELREGLRGVLINLSYSPSFLLGLVLWIAALILSQQVLTGGRASRGTWAALAVVVCGCAMTKSLLVPMLFGGLGLLAAWSLVRRRRVEPPLLGLLAVTGGVLAVSLATVYRDAGAVLKLDPLAHLWAAPDLPVPVSWAATAAGAAVSVVALFIAPLIGMLWLTRREATSAALGVAVLVVAVGGTALTATDASDEVYFLQYGLVPAAVLAAAGLTRLWQAPGSARLSLVQKLAIAALLALAILGLDIPRDPGDWIRSIQVAAILVAAIVFAVRSGSRTRLAAVLVVAGVALVATQETQPRPFYEIRTSARLAEWAGLPVDAPARPGYEVRMGRAAGLGLATRTPMPRGVFAGLRWVSRNTPADSVLIGPRRRDGIRVETEFGYAAFSERRTVIAGTFYSLAAANAGYLTIFDSATPLFPDRERLQDRVYEACDRLALRELSDRYEATHLLIDRTRGELMPECLRSLGRIVFDGRDLTVVDVR